MRKVWLILFTITMLVVAMALPAMAATQGSGNTPWSLPNSPAITQPTDTSIPGNCPTGNLGTNVPSNGFNVDLSKIFEQFKATIGQNIPTIFNGGINCPN